MKILIINIHGLIRSNNLELGKDSDTGGQTKYVYEYANELSRQPGVKQVTILSRLIKDKRYAHEYGLEKEEINKNLHILRVTCGGNRYLKKEKLWSYLDEFISNALGLFISQDLNFDLIHSHYADAGYIALELSKLLNIPYIHTGHSLGIQKREKLREINISDEQMEEEYKISHRISVENDILKSAKLIITSTQQEIDYQWAAYQNFKQANFKVIPPGIDFSHFYPFLMQPEIELNKLVQQDITDYDNQQEIQEDISKELTRFLTEPHKPLILTICRPEKRKNIEGLINCYGQDKELQELANLAIFAGIRKDISKKTRLEAKILMDMLLLLDKYDLYGKLAIPKSHEYQNEVPELYRLAASLKGVFINTAFTEPFGLTLLEAGISGLPVVATNDGGPLDIIKRCKNGVLVDVHDTQSMATALKEILKQPKLWKQYSANGIKNTYNYYSWNSHCKNLINSIENYPILHKKTQIKQSFKEKLFSFKYLIITDIDNTLIGGDKELDNFLNWFSENNNQFGLAVATGRNIDSARNVLKEQKIPVPEIFITSVGTEVYYQYDGELWPDKYWENYLNEKWNPQQIKEILSEFDFLEDQEDQRKFKISYYIKNASKEKIGRIHKALKSTKLRYKLILTENYLLDILPYRSSKYKAIIHIAKKWRLNMDKILVSGDSGNDREMLRKIKNAVVVANHQNELKNLSGAYFSKKQFAEAILDGLNYYNFS